MEEDLIHALHANNEKLHDSVVQMHTIYILLQGPDVSLRTHFITIPLPGNELLYRTCFFFFFHKDIYQDMKLIDMACGYPQIEIMVEHSRSPFLSLIEKTRDKGILNLIYKFLLL